MSGPSSEPLVLCDELNTITLDPPSVDAWLDAYLSDQALKVKVPECPYGVKCFSLMSKSST